MRRPTSARIAAAVLSAAAALTVGLVAAPAASADPPCSATVTWSPGSTLPCTSPAAGHVPHLTGNLGRRFG